jgi:hypothetical protein
MQTRLIRTGEGGMYACGGAGRDKRPGLLLPSTVDIYLGWLKETEATVWHYCPSQEETFCDKGNNHVL